MISKLPEIIEFSELGAFIDEPVRTYSSGMKARLGLAVASAIHPDILLIDEVLGVGDASFRKKSEERGKEMIAESGTVVMVSHSLGMLKKICTRIVLVDNGEIVFVGDVDEGINRYSNNS